MIEMYDVGRVLVKPWLAGYEFIANHGQDYISDPESFERIVGFHRDRSRKLKQQDFDMLNDAWVQAIRDGKLPVDPSIVYSDVAPRFNAVKARGDKVFLHTSGSKELIDFMLNEACSYDEVLVGSETGDKNNPETFAGIWDYTEGGVLAFYDDKPSVLSAAVEGFRMAGGSPKLYLIDRQSVVGQEQVEKLRADGVVKITSLDDI
jgi:hypothetical protein